MLNQKRSGNLARLKYLVAVPICAGLLCASTLVFSKNYGWIDLAPRYENAILTPVTAHNPGIDTSQIAVEAKAAHTIKATPGGGLHATGDETQKYKPNTEGLFYAGDTGPKPGALG